MMQLSGEKQVNRTPQKQTVPSTAKNASLREQAKGRIMGLLRLLVADNDVDKAILSESGGMAIEL